MLEAIKAGSGEASSRARVAHVCGAEAQLANIRHKSNSIKKVKPSKVLRDCRRITEEKRS
jgi:hypothetical protein